MGREPCKPPPRSNTWAQRSHADAIDDLGAFYSNLMRSNGERAMGAATLAGKERVALGVLGGALSMLTAWCISSGIVGPIRHAVKVARTAASGTSPATSKSARRTRSPNCRRRSRK